MTNPQLPTPPTEPCLWCLAIGPKNLTNHKTMALQKPNQGLTIAQNALDLVIGRHQKGMAHDPRSTQVPASPFRQGPRHIHLG